MTVRGVDSDLHYPVRRSSVQVQNVAIVVSSTCRPLSDHDTWPTRNLRLQLAVCD